MKCIPVQGRRAILSVRVVSPAHFVFEPQTQLKNDGYTGFVTTEHYKVHIEVTTVLLYSIQYEIRLNKPW